MAEVPGTAGRHGPRLAVEGATTSRKSYVGRKVTVSFDPGLCEHSGICLRGLPAVFDVGRRPWVDADGASADLVVAQVGRCPSGALRIEPR